MIDQEVTCYHCGEDCQQGLITSEDKSFCCEGCKAVYTLLNDTNMCQYYQFDHHPGTSPDILSLSGKYAWLDDSELSSSLLEFKQGNRSHVTLSVPVMHCSSCIWLLEHLSRLDHGIIRSTVNFPARIVSVEFDNQITSLRNVVEWMTRVGYEPTFAQQEISLDDNKKRNRSAFYKIGIAGFAFGNIMMLSLPDYFAGGMFAHNQDLHGLFMGLSFLLSLPVVFYSASEFFVSAWQGLRGRFLNIDLPIALAIGVTFLRSVWDLTTASGTGFFDSMTGIVFFMLIGRFFQNRTWQRLSFDRDYKSYFPVAVTLKVNKTEKPISVADIKVGDRLIIRNQELIPADAILMSDDSLVDYSFVTGESVPVAQKQGDRLYAGGRLNGPIAEMEVIRPMEQSYLTRLWNNPVFKRSHQSDQTVYVENINRWFTAITLVLAFGALGYWMPQDATKAMNAFTAVLIIACPCALLLAATFTHGNMLRILGLNGLYLRSAQVIERLSESTGIIFDKTGTITNSQRTRLEWMGIDLDETQRNAVYSLVIQSAHPYSRLVSREWGNNHRTPITQFEEIPGAGLKGMVGNEWVWVGNRAFVEAKKEADIEEGSIWVRIGDQVLGYFTVKQEYRTGLEHFIRKLSRSFQLALLSGDNSREASKLRPIFGENAPMLFEQSPEDKMARVREFQESGSKWIMVGDGLNDAGALAQSHAGIAVTDDLNRFSPACDAILDGKKLTMLDTFIDYARKGKSIVTLAFGVSLIYNVIGLSYAMSGTLSPVVAAILMPIMSISIVVLSTLTGTWLARQKGLAVSSTKVEGAPL